MPRYKVSLEIVDILGDGNCPVKHQIGEKFEYPDDRGKICAVAFHSIYPYIRIMESGGEFPWFDEPNAHSACCPDYKRPVVFKVSRVKVPD